MRHFTTMKKALTCAVSAAMLASTASVMSVPAAAADSNYAEALALSLYFFDSNACGSGITNGPLTWRGDCHTYDAAASVGSLSGTARSVVDPDGDGKVDLSGGYHDAGDHIKFNLTIGFGMSSLAMSEYLNPGVYEACGCKDHLIYVLKRGCDYLMKTTFLDSSGNVAAIAHVVADGGTDHSYWTAPEEQTFARPAYWLTSSANNSPVCGEMAAALAGTAYVVKDTDPTYAAECLKYAKALVTFGKTYVGNEGGGLSSFYGTDSQYQDEMAIAETWLWLCGEGSKPTYSVTGNGCYNNSLYDYYLYCWDKVWQGYAAMMYKATGESSWASELAFELNNQGGLSEGSYNANGWGASRYNCAKQMVALALAKGDANSSYAKGAKYQMDYILGNNSLGYSFLIGYGSKWPTHVHHRAANPGGDGVTSAQNPEAWYTNYGMLVGGPDSSGNYQDHADSYQFTEGALDYNGCFALACAGLYALYGGDETAVKTIEKNASEINDSFFSGSTTQTTTTTTTTTTTITTTETTAISGIMRGDVDCNGKVELADAVLLAKAIAGNAQLTAQGTANGDVDDAQGLGSGDLLLILKALSGSIKL